MLLKKKRVRNLRAKPTSFRFSEEAFYTLKILADVYGKKDIEVIEELLEEGLKAAQKAYPHDVRKAQKAHR